MFRSARDGPVAAPGGKGARLMKTQAPEVSQGQNHSASSATTLVLDSEVTYTIETTFMLVVLRYLGSATLFT